MYDYMRGSNTRWVYDDFLQWILEQSHSPSAVWGYTVYNSIISLMR